MTIEKLYDSLNCEEVKDNPFETKAIIKARKDFYDKYLRPFMPFSERDDAEYLLIKIVDMANRTAFAVGYETALSLVEPATKKQKAPGVVAPDAF